MESSPLVGVCLCHENSVGNGKIVETLYIRPEDHSQVLHKLRGRISPASVSGKKFVFLNPCGWEINPKLEHLVKLSDVVTKENTVNVKISHDKPRIGIQIQDCSDVVVGFVHCNLSSNVSELARELSAQLPDLYSGMQKSKFCFLDRNGWPIAKEQEQSLTVMEISTTSCVKIRLFQNIAQLFATRSTSRKVSYAGSESNFRIMEDPEKSLFSYQEQHPLSLPAIEEGLDTTMNQSWKRLSEYSGHMISEMDYEPFQILLSYVHTEASVYAEQIKEALEVLGYSVFLDIHCIEGGRDWQDVLNDAISNCSLFVPLITMQYGQTLWTNREVKLADVLGKLILPVNFNQTWPPKCLAIQFATTQYIPSNKYANGGEVTPETFTEEMASKIAVDVADRFRQDLSADDSVENDSSTPSLLSRQSTDILASSPPSSAGMAVPQGISLGRRKSALKSYASNLPESVPKDIQKSMLESKEGKPLVVISCSVMQRSFAGTLSSQMKEKGYDIWYSCDIVCHSEEEKLLAFQQKVDVAGAVVFILSKDFAEDVFCEEQVYYCEQRKRIVPFLFESLEMPNWMATLIGTNMFINMQSENYLTSLLDRLDVLLNPQKAEKELKEVLQQKMEIASLCHDLESNMPKGKHVYISGGTKFFSKDGEEICREIGRELAQDTGIVLITGGFFGVGETVGRSFFEERERMQAPHGVCHIVAIRDDEDKSKLTRQNPDRTFMEVPYGDTLFYGNSVRQRETLTPRVFDLCILVEGGPGAAFEAQQFVWNGHRVIPVRVTGGAAGGMFNVPPSISVRPPSVNESDWNTLGDSTATPSEIAAAVTRIVQVLKNPAESPLALSRSNTMTKDDKSTSSGSFKRSKVMIKRSDTVALAEHQKRLQKSFTDHQLNAATRSLSDKLKRTRTSSAN